MQFSQVIGQARAKEKLLNMYRSGRVPHALLISASEGYGGLPLAVALAQLLNCENPTETDSCGACDSCVKSKKLIHPDIFFTYPTVPGKAGQKTVCTDYIQEWRKAFLKDPYLTYQQWLAEISSDNKQGNITVAECHEIIKRISLKNYEGRYKIQIIWMAELMKEYGNTLLKSIEEPPPNTYFILVTEQPDQILSTILSRTQMIRLPPIELAALEAALKEKLDFESKEQARHWATLASGSWAAAQDVLLSRDWDVESIFLNWLRYCAGRFSPQTATGIMKTLDEFFELKREKQKLFVRYGLFFIHNCLNEKNSVQNYLQQEALEVSKKIAQRYGVEVLAGIEDLLNKLYYQIERNANPRIALHSLSIRLNEMMTVQSMSEFPY
jgi:DNA polymerase-3 subunit delta'